MKATTVGPSPNCLTTLRIASAWTSLVEDGSSNLEYVYTWKNFVWWQSFLVLKMCSPCSALIIISNPVCSVPKLKINIIRIKNWMSQVRAGWTVSTAGLVPALTIVYLYSNKYFQTGWVLF